ncbi:MAG TPA: RIP metalloprotease RseP [Oscillatoriaceae cyanobacterium M33_DOE_052]|uniref:Zinc metalloprotease n=1 Tax=Planktothricoides sp. SpSt-374 TaxID=2282167 RepID=A0A7C3ZU12_9CYAN|nr:RIP metalloprotease RseP [Oscillatoriaceae cyanobacterium M33_DOE_052]
MSVLAAIAVLAILIVVHELGHFLAARLQGIHVNRFSIGFGPILWKYQGPETEYAIRGFPLGGYVGFPDDDPSSNIPPDDPNLLRNRPLLDRAIVISAGVIANLIFAYLLLVMQVATVGVPEFQYQPGVMVAEVISDTTPAYKAGLRAEDTIIMADGAEIGAGQKAMKSLIEIIQNNPNEAISIAIQRNGEKRFLQITPEKSENGKGMIGVQLAPNGKGIRRRADNILQAFGAGAAEFERIAWLTASGFVQLIRNFGETADQVAGPVAIVAIGANIAKDDAANLFQFASLISINLAIINILPLPALDGGQLAFLLIEGLRGKPVPTHIQDGVMQTGLMLLLGLGIFLIIRDTTQLEWVQKLFQ